jgi:hypothetical protein
MAARDQIAAQLRAIEPLVEAEEAEPVAPVARVSKAAKSGKGSGKKTKAGAATGPFFDRRAHTRDDSLITFVRLWLFFTMPSFA